MHELSIAQGIIEIAFNEKQKAGAAIITEIELEVGKLAGVDYHSLEFALKTILESSGMSSVNIVVHKPEGKAVCKDCSSEFLINSYVAECPLCKSYKYHIKEGKELRLKSVSVE